MSCCLQRQNCNGRSEWSSITSPRVPVLNLFGLQVPSPTYPSPYLVPIYVGPYPAPQSLRAFFIPAQRASPVYRRLASSSSSIPSSFLSLPSLSLGGVGQRQLPRGDLPPLRDARRGGAGLLPLTQTLSLPSLSLSLEGAPRGRWDYCP
jgi:hypothetical protein